MKAIYNITGEIVDIEDMSVVTYKESDGTYVKTLIKNFTFIDAEKDYYTKLEHQAAIAAMQGILSNPSITERKLTTRKGIVEDVERLAHALVEMMKEAK